LQLQSDSTSAKMLVHQSELEHQYELQHLPWPDKSPDLNFIKQLWAVLERKVRNRFSPPTSLKQLADVPLYTIQKLYESILRSCIKGKCG
uniref:Tc1-like transposase DDE domain-containing protein n=1 Tax=Sinocyclocheilus grahami TaxID=75366 RepID=A0A672P4I3_SINGR